jgi:hypothetical protein
LDKEIQFNDLGSFGSSANLSFNKTTGLLSTSRIYVAANAQIVGNVTASKLISNNSIGDSGGELLLALPAANTTLSGLGITIDAFQNKIRFYEQGGTNRGAYIDLTEAAANVGTNLLTAGSGSGNNALQYRSSYTANSGQTVFAATYIPGYVDTFINGVKLTPGTDFTATNGTTITLSEGAVANDSVEIIGYVTVSTTLPDAIQHRYSYTANAAQTTFAAVYVSPYVDVFKNGVRLSPTSNYIANNGTEIILTAGAALADLIEIVGYSSYTATVGQADQLTTGRTIGMTGDVTWTSNSFNGTANVTGTSTLANTGVTAGTYTKVTVDAKGRVTTGNTLSSSDIPTLNQNTTGSAATATTATNVSGGTANVTSLTTSSTVTLNGGTANGVAYLNGSKVLTTGSALTFDGTNLGIGNNNPGYPLDVTPSSNSVGVRVRGRSADNLGAIIFDNNTGSANTQVNYIQSVPNSYLAMGTNNTERMRIESGGAITFKASGSANTTHSFIYNENGGEIQLHNAAGGTDVLFDSVSGTTRLLTFNGSLQIGSPNSHDIFFSPGGSERMRILSGGNVGIGTSNPFYQVTILRRASSTITAPLLNLQSQNSGSVDGDSFILYGTQTANWAAGVDQADSNKFRIEPTTTLGAADGLTITTSGNLGIGTSAPFPATSRRGLVVRDGSGNGAELILQSTATTNGTSDGVALIAAGSDAYVYNRISGGFMAFGTSNTERVRIDSSGSVGIGVTNPGQKLHVAGNAQIGAVASTDSILYVNPGSGTKGKTGFTWYGATFGASWPGGDTGHRMVFRSGASNTGADAWTTMVYDIDSNQMDAISWVNRFRINGNSGDVILGNNGGNLLVGTSSFTTGGIQKTIVSSGTASAGFQIQLSGNVGSYIYGYTSSAVGYRVETTSSYPNIQMVSGGTGGVSLSSGATAWASMSDERLKTNLLPITDAVEKVCSLRTVTGRYESDDVSVSRAFLIAQDVQAVLPQAVTTIKQKDDDAEYLGLQYTDTIPLLVAAIKELKAEFDAYKLSHP